MPKKLDFILLYKIPMDINTGLSVAILIITSALALYVFHAEREIRKVKRRLRFLHERLEAVEKFNGLNSTNTDIRIMKTWVLVE